MAGALSLLPEGLSQANVLNVVLAITLIGRVLLRKMVNARIGKHGACPFLGLDKLALVPNAASATTPDNELDLPIDFYNSVIVAWMLS